MGEQDRPTKGQLEAAVTAAITQFEREYLGRGPRHARTYLVEDMIVVRLQGILSPAELALSEEPGGIEMIKQMRSRLIESCADELVQLVAGTVGARVSSMHADISARSGERVFVFIVEHDLEALLAG